MPDTLRFDKASPEMQTWIRQAAQAAGIEPMVLASVMQAENSSFSPRPPDGTKHEIGPMQLMPETRQYFHLSDQQARDPRTNIFAGAQWLRHKINLAGGRVDRGVVAYNGVGEKAEAYGRTVMNRLKPSAYTSTAVTKPISTDQPLRTPQGITQPQAITFDLSRAQKVPSQGQQPSGGPAFDLSRAQKVTQEPGFIEKYLPQPGSAEWKKLPGIVQAFETGPAQFIGTVGTGLKDIRDLNTLNILRQIYKQQTGQPNILREIPGRAATAMAPFLLGAPAETGAMETGEEAMQATQRRVAQARAQRAAIRPTLPVARPAVQTAAESPSMLRRLGRAAYAATKEKALYHFPGRSWWKAGRAGLEAFREGMPEAETTGAPPPPTAARRTPAVRIPKQQVPPEITQAYQGLGRGPQPTIEDMAAALQGRPVPPPSPPGPPRVPPFWQTGQAPEAPVRLPYSGQTASQAYAEQRAAERAARAAGRTPPAPRPPRTPPAWQTAVPPEPVPRQASPTATESQAYVQQRAAERAARQMTPEARAGRARAALDEIARQQQPPPVAAQPAAPKEGIFPKTAAAPGTRATRPTKISAPRAEMPAQSPVAAFKPEDVTFDVPKKLGKKALSIPYTPNSPSFEKMVAGTPRQMARTMFPNMEIEEVGLTHEPSSRGRRLNIVFKNAADAKRAFDSFQAPSYQQGGVIGQPSGASSGWGPDYGYIRHEMVPTVPSGNPNWWQKTKNLVVGLPLTEQQRRYFDPLYGQQMNLKNIRVHHVPWNNPNWAGAVMGGVPNQIWLTPQGESEDVLAHELAHITQPAFSFRTRSYDVDPETIGKRGFHQLGQEQQAEVLRKYYLMMTDPIRRHYLPESVVHSKRWLAQQPKINRQRQQEQETYQRLVEQYLRGVR